MARNHCAEHHVALLHGDGRIQLGQSCLQPQRPGGMLLTALHEVNARGRPGRLLTRRSGEDSLLSMTEASADSPSQQPPDNSDVARVLHRIADLLEFQDDNLFKLRAYRMAAETIDELRSSVAELSARGGAAELQKIPGIGKAISAQVIEILRTGTAAYFEALKRELPETVLDLRRVAGVGLKTAQLLYRDFGITNLEDFNAFAAGGGLHSVPGLGDKMIQRIRVSLARICALQDEA